MAKFRYNVIGDTTTVSFQRYCGYATAKPGDTFVLETGIGIALFRAMKKRLLDGKHPKSGHGHGDESTFIKPLFSGSIPEWRRWTGKYIAYMSYHRGYADAIPEKGAIFYSFSTIYMFGAATKKDKSADETFLECHQVPITFKEN